MSKIFFISSEVFPYSKTGGLADVSASLPKALKKKGVDIITITPFYEGVVDKRERVDSADIDFEIYINDQSYFFEVFKSSSDCRVYFLKNEFVFGRKEIYGDYIDNYMRFGLFSLASIELAKRVGLSDDDIFHLNDWQSALVPFFLKKFYHLQNGTLLTLHNVAYQGVFPSYALDHLGVDEKDYLDFEFYGMINFLKVGILYSDFITTVSKSYLNEIRSEFGFGLEGVVEYYSYKFRGVVNGLDEELFSPVCDANLVQNYSSSEYSLRNINKKSLVEELGLLKKSAPLYAFIGRLVPQKGIDRVLELVEFCKNIEANFVIIGDGNKEIESRLTRLAKSYKNLYFYNGYNESISRRVYASSDFLLMPSLYEPCGLAQMIASKYGSIPIVRGVGGLKDTVADYRDIVDFEGKSKGVVFKEDSFEDFLKAFVASMALYCDSAKYRECAISNMEIDFNWSSSALEYIDIYNLLKRGVDEFKK